MNLTTIITMIEILENKQEAGTITMCEESKLCFLIERAEQLIYKFSS
jgi:hypothetical protein